MLVVRPVRLEDAEGLDRFAMTSGIGLTHLPKQYDALEAKIQMSIDSIEQEVSTPGFEEYTFVLEDTEKNDIGGTSGIIASTGKQKPWYVFQIETLPPLPPGLPTPKERRELHIKAYQGGAAEICALYLLPEYRQGGLGRLISLSRFLFMASYPKRFPDTIIANMRGIIDKDGISAFWNGLGRNFLDMELSSVMLLRTSGEEFVTQIYPHYPIPVAILNSQVKEGIGKVHPHTQPAIKMLMEEGFHIINQVDPFDGGPILSAQKNEVKTIIKSQEAIVESTPIELVEPGQYIISNGLLDFRACYSAMKFTEKNRVMVSKEVADALKIKIGDSVRYIPSLPQTI
jgi:arginine N-succinyltransferase